MKRQIITEIKELANLVRDNKKESKTKWGTRYSSKKDYGFCVESKYLVVPSILTLSTKMGLPILGGALGYLVGLGAGELAEHIPYMNEYLVKGAQFVSGLNLNGDLGGVGGLAGLVYGAINSGMKLDHNELVPKEVKCGPIFFRRF